MMQGREKSDSGTVAVKSANNSMTWLVCEGKQDGASRCGADGASGWSQGEREPIRQAPDAEPPLFAFPPLARGLSRRLDRVRERAKSHKTERFTSLLHYTTPEVLALAFSWLKRDAASGIDGVTWKDYETNQEAKLADLHQRLHRGGFRALPSKLVKEGRKYIPKADGRLRPLGIAALEDAYLISPPPAQGVQRAVVAFLIDLFAKANKC